MNRVVRGLIPALTLLGAIAVACKSTSAPVITDPLVGTWKVTLDTLQGLVTFSPNPLTLTITKTDSVYRATWPNDTLFERVIGAQAVLSDSSAHSAFVVRGDTLSLSLGWSNECSASLFGTVSGRTAAGTVSLVGLDCAILLSTPGPWPTGTWSATKQ